MTLETQMVIFKKKKMMREIELNIIFHDGNRTNFFGGR